MIDTGAVFNYSWGSQGCQKGPFWRSWGTLGCQFLGLGVALGAHFGVLGVPLDALGAQSSQKSPPLFQRCLVLSDCGAQNEPHRVPKWSYN